MLYAFFVLFYSYLLFIIIGIYAANCPNLGCYASKHFIFAFARAMLPQLQPHSSYHLFARIPVVRSLGSLGAAQ